EGWCDLHGGYIPVPHGLARPPGTVGLHHPAGGVAPFVQGDKIECSHVTTPCLPAAIPRGWWCPPKLFRHRRQKWTGYRVSLPATLPARSCCRESSSEACR